MHKFQNQNIKSEEVNKKEENSTKIMTSKKFEQSISKPISNKMTPRMIRINKLLGKDIAINSTTAASDISKIEHKIPNTQIRKIKITPLAKAIATDHNLNISLIVGTGINNKIMQSDVLDLININNKITPVDNTKTEIMKVEKANVGDKRIKVTNLRKTIARAMKNSWDTVAYTNLFTEIDMTKLWEFRSKIKSRIFNKTGIKITFLSFIIKALSIAIKNYPNMNATYDDKTSELVLKESFNAGIAVDTKAGLVVPVIKKADEISILAIASEITRLGELARNRKLEIKDISGGSFSITNYGSFGALAGVPVINYPELALAGVGSIVDKVSIINEQVSPRKSMLLTVAADHRWIDGGDIAKFARDVKELLEEPAMLWIEKEINNV